MFNSQGFLYGRGIFTTVAFRDGRLLLWEKHWRRIGNDSAAIGLNIGEFSESEVLSRAAAAIDESGIRSGRLRLTFSDASTSALWSVSGRREAACGLSVMVGGSRRLPAPFRVTVSPYNVLSTDPLNRVKTCNYLGRILALEEANERGFNEAIRLNERGQITGGCVSNVFWLKGDTLFTPPLSTGCLPGTTREFVMDNIRCEEVEAGLSELVNADAAFLTSAGLGIAAIDELDGRPLAKPPHLITDLLAVL
jgi:branched-subunit amino acid aminotransferase/4-amino-4-deoxychorismate lyase